jgi:hypothetical protein
MCPVLRSIAADSSEATLLRSRRFEMSQRFSSLLSTNVVTAPPVFISHGHGYGDGMDEDDSKARRRVEQHFDHGSLVRLLGGAVRRLCRYIEVAS